MRNYQLAFRALSDANRRRSEAVFHTIDEWSPPDWGMALVGEVGELCNQLKKRRRGEAVDDELVGDELADCVLYLDLLSQRMEIYLHAELRQYLTITTAGDVTFDHLELAASRIHNAAVRDGQRAKTIPELCCELGKLAGRLAGLACTWFWDGGTSEGDELERCIVSAILRTIIQLETIAQQVGVRLDVCVIRKFNAVSRSRDATVLIGPPAEPIVEEPVHGQ